MAMTPPLTLDLLDTIAVGMAVKLEDAVEAEIAIGIDAMTVVMPRGGEEVVSGNVNIGAKFMLVNTACSAMPAG